MAEATMSADDSLTLAMEVLDIAKTSPKPDGTLTYDSLPTPRSIRVLKLPEKRPEPSSLESLIHVTMHTISLDDPPAFNALSYTWGKPYRDPFGDDDQESPPEFVQTMRCNKFAVKITQNLFDALSSFIEVGITGYLWVDAVCINQQNFDERSVQVSLMGEIYSKAHTVLAWLGPVAEGIEELQWAVTSFLDLVYSPTSDNFLQAPFSPGNLLDMDFWVTRGLEYPTPKLVKAYEFYTACRWFGRIWILQEMTLARRLQMYCGAMELSFERLKDFATMMRAAGWCGESMTASMIEHDFRVGRHWLTEIANVWLLSDSSEIGKWGTSDGLVVWKKDSPLTPIPLLQCLLWVSRSWKCLDPRDKVYALLGFFSHFRNPHGKAYHDHLIRADYQVDVATLFTKAMILLLSETVTLDLLGDTRKPGNSGGIRLPSWVIDFSSAEQANPITLSELRIDASQYTRSLYPRFEVSEDVLRCFGARFDVIGNVQQSGLQRAMEMEPQSLVKFIEFYLGLPLLIGADPRMLSVCKTIFINEPPEEDGPGKQNHGAMEPPVDMFAAFVTSCLVWLLLRHWDGSLCSRDCAQIFEKFKLSPTSSERAIYQYLIDKSFFAADDPSYTNAAPLTHLGREATIVSNQCATFTALASHSIIRRRLFTTRRGFLGTGIENLHEGDQIWLLCDARAPMILRPTESTDEYEVVGDCYIIGFMNGEMLNDEWGVKENIHRIKIV